MPILSELIESIELFVEENHNELFIDKHLDKNMRKSVYEIIESKKLYYKNILLYLNILIMIVLLKNVQIITV